MRERERKKGRERKKERDKEREGERERNLKIELYSTHNIRSGQLNINYLFIAHPKGSGGVHFPFKEHLLKHTSSILTCTVRIRGGVLRPYNAMNHMPGTVYRERGRDRERVYEKGKEKFNQISYEGQL